MTQRLNSLPWFSPRERKKRNSPIRMEKVVKAEGVRRSQRIGPSMYRNKVGQENSVSQKIGCGRGKSSR
jgi:hypothetical protein